MRRLFGIPNLDLTVFMPRRQATPIGDFFEMLDRRDPNAGRRLEVRLPSEADGPTPHERARFEADWLFVAGKASKRNRRLMQFIEQKDPRCRELRSGGNKSKTMAQAKAELKEISRVVAEYHTAMNLVHHYFSTKDSVNQSFVMTMNEFNDLCTFLNIQDPKAQPDTVRPQDLQMCFNQATFSEDGGRTSYVCRHNFVCVCLRICVRVFCALPVGVAEEAEASPSISHALRRFVEHLMDTAAKHASIAVSYPDKFRFQRFYSKSVNDVLAKHLVFLRAVYVRYKAGVRMNLVPSNAGVGSFPAHYMGQQAFMQVLEMMRILGGERIEEQSSTTKIEQSADDSATPNQFGITRREAELCFTRSVLTQVDMQSEGAQTASVDTLLDCVGFFEALCRVSEILSPPPRVKRSTSAVWTQKVTGGEDTSIEDTKEDLVNFFGLLEESELPPFPTWRFLDSIEGPVLSDDERIRVDDAFAAKVSPTAAHACFPRASRGIFTPKTRPLAEKLESCIELMYRGLCSNNRKPNPLYRTNWGDPLAEGPGTSAANAGWVLKLVDKMEEEGRTGYLVNAHAQARCRKAKDGTYRLTATPTAEVDAFLKRHVV